MVFFTVLLKAATNLGFTFMNLITASSLLAKFSWYLNFHTHFILHLTYFGCTCFLAGGLQMQPFAICQSRYEWPNFCHLYHSLVLLLCIVYSHALLAKSLGMRLRYSQVKFLGSPPLCVLGQLPHR